MPGDDKDVQFVLITVLYGWTRRLRNTTRKSSVGAFFDFCFTAIACLFLLFLFCHFKPFGIHWKNEVLAVDSWFRSYLYLHCQAFSQKEAIFLEDWVDVDSEWTNFAWFLEVLLDQRVNQSLENYQSTLPHPRVCSWWHHLTFMERETERERERAPPRKPPQNWYSKGRTWSQTWLCNKQIHAWKSTSNNKCQAVI